jgi:hypothetical protein
MPHVLPEKTSIVNVTNVAGVGVVSADAVIVTLIVSQGINKVIAHE